MYFLKGMFNVIQSGKGQSSLIGGGYCFFDHLIQCYYLKIRFKIRIGPKWDTQLELGQICEFCILTASCPTHVEHDAAKMRN